MDDNTTVQLYIYDLTSGMAAMMSQMLLGRHIEGVWHTAVVVYGREFFYGGSGIQSCMPVSKSIQIEEHYQIINSSINLEFLCESKNDVPCTLTHTLYATGMIDSVMHRET